MINGSVQAGYFDQPDLSSQEVCRCYLAMIAGGSGGFLEVRWRRSSGTGMGQHFQPIESCDALVDDIGRRGRCTDVYLGCAPRVQQRGTGDAVAAVNVLWVDVDTPQAVGLLAMFDPPPAMVVLTGGVTDGYAHRHAYWPLTAPISAEDAVRSNRRLAYALDGDIRSTDAARILRPPGTFNHKNRPPAPVECIRLDAVSYDPLEVAGPLPDPPRGGRRSRSEGTACRSNDPLHRIPATEYVPYLTGREVSGDGKIACPFHDDRTPSLHVYPEDRGWVCFGCGRGGSIIDFGAALYGIEPRGSGYQLIKQRLASDLLGALREARRP